MRAMSRSRVRVDLISTTTDAAELAKLSNKIGYRLTLDWERAEDGTSKAVADLEGHDDEWLASSIASLCIVESITRDLPASVVLDQLRRELENRHVPMDIRPSDGRGIGEGHNDGP